MAINWEVLNSTGCETTERAKVPGGWLVRFYYGDGINDGGYGYGGMTFYPDPHHEWDGNSLSKDEHNNARRW